LFRLAHVTDPHFRGLAGLTLGELAGKRAIGLVNLALNRRRKHKSELLDALVIDLRAQAVDHLALTGDLSNVSLPAEWQAALRWLQAYQAPPDAVTVIPGNHDAYVADVIKDGTFERLFASFQTSDETSVQLSSQLSPQISPQLSAAAPPPNGASPELGSSRGRYPFLRLRGPVAIIGVNSCVATGDLGAWGEVGEAQLARLEAMLTSAEIAHHVRVLLIHHPPVMHKGGEGRNLRDRAALAAVLARAGADLVLHGHDHRDESALLEGPAGRRISVIGAGSASYAGGPEQRARYNIYEIGCDAITAITRAHDEATDLFKEVRREKLS
jgi:3',5'-cyclic AMP phosphodiesterase CpdA